MKTPDINKLLKARPRSGQYGAPMGRRNVFDETHAGPLYCQRVRFVDGDYSADGTYWGGGHGVAPLWAMFSRDLETLCFYRAADRMTAVRAFDDEHGDARRYALANFAKMRASLDTKAGRVEVTRRPGAPRARTEAHFWGLLRDALNDDGNAARYVWALTRPHKYALTGMPYALARGRNREEMVIDNDYAIRDVRALYNAGETVRLHYITERVSP